MSGVLIEDIAGALEAAIAALFALFSVFAFMRARDDAPALYFLAAAADLIAFMLSGNFLAAEISGMQWMNTLNIALELLTLAAIYLYVRQARPGAQPLALADGLHAVPAALGLGLRYFAVGWVDAYVILAALAYLAGGFGYIIRFRDDFPAGFKKFAIPLLVAFLLVVLLRAMMAAAPNLANGYRTMTAYVLLLGAVLAAASLVLLTALLRPNIVSAITPIPKYARDQTNKDQVAALARDLSALLGREKPFLKPDLTLEDLAQRLGVSPRLVSQLINSEYGDNFSAYMNVLRVEFAKELLKQSPVDTPIKSVMYDSGFRSKSVFNREFLRICGQTPSRFREQRKHSGPGDSAD